MDYKPPKAVQSEARRALKWIEEGHAGSGFTDTGRKRASDLARGAAVSRETIGRIANYLARHEGDKKGQGWNPGEEGYPSPGRVAWAAWGGDPAKSWTSSILDSEDKALNIELKSMTATVESDIAESDEFPNGGFTAVASTPSLDRDGDKLEREEWIEPLPDHITIDIDHEMSVRGTVGSARPFFDEDGRLMIEAAFASTAQAQETRTLIREGHIRTVSVAFMTDKSKKSGEPRRELLNVGIVAIPSNRDAVIVGAKEAAVVETAVSPLRRMLKAAGDDAALLQIIHDAVCQLGACCDDMDEAEEADEMKDGCDCWDGYERVPGTTPCAPGSCRKCDAAGKSADDSNIETDEGEKSSDISIDEFKASLDSLFKTTPPESPVESPVVEAAAEPETVEVEDSAPAEAAADEAADAVALRARLMAMSVLADSVLASES